MIHLSLYYEWEQTILILPCRGKQQTMCINRFLKISAHIKSTCREVYDNINQYAIQYVSIGIWTNILIAFHGWIL